MNSKSLTIKFIVLLFISFGISKNIYSQKKYGSVDIEFYFSVNNKTLVLNDSNYNNEWNDIFNISKLKILIGKVAFDTTAISSNGDNYLLIDAARKNNSLLSKLPIGQYNQLHFLLGVDSIDNCSGAQQGALDPVNDMFWTWNSGYVFFKLEGFSSSSTSDLSRIQYHIGGYKKHNSAVNYISLHQNNLADKIIVEEDKTTKIFLEINIDNFWKGPTNIMISNTSVCMSPGSLAKDISLNFKNLFSINKIQIEN